jgi:hypothetical protein
MFSFLSVVCLFRVRKILKNAKSKSKSWKSRTARRPHAVIKEVKERINNKKLSNVEHTGLHIDRAVYF